jgi:CubicO group peptidase (beta-lactamase class C family)
MTRDTVFDVASLTKPIATATSILVLVDRQKLSLNDYVSQYLPAFACRGKEGVQIKHLLAHSSGLPAYTSADDLAKQHGNPCPDGIIEKICSLEALSQPGIEFRYSCLGYIVLAKIVEIVAAQSIRDFTQENIFVPLAMRHTTYNPPASWQSHTAATEIVNDKLLRGTVHDPLARLMGGAAGNAGIFSSASDLSIYCRMLLNGGVWKDRRILSPCAVGLLTHEQSNGRAYGFDVSSSYSWVKGPYASKEAFCHTGYTGVSLACDPASRTYLIILTNRVHPNDSGKDRAIRLKIAELVFQGAASGGL